MDSNIFTISFAEAMSDGRYSIVFITNYKYTCRRSAKDRRSHEYRIVEVLGINPAGKKEQIALFLFGEDEAVDYCSVVMALKEQGVDKVLLFVCPGDEILKSALTASYPDSMIQTSWYSILHDAELLSFSNWDPSLIRDVRAIHSMSTSEDAKKQMEYVKNVYGGTYPKLVDQLDDDNLLTFFKFPSSIFSNIYSSQLPNALITQLKAMLNGRGYKCKKILAKSIVRKMELINERIKFSNNVIAGFGVARGELIRRLDLL